MPLFVMLLRLPMSANYNATSRSLGNAEAQLIETLCYKPEGRGFDSRRGHWIFNSPNPSSRTMALGSTQPLTEMSTKNLPGGKGRPARKADNLTAICEPTV
jgi:hypothetical protein